MKANCGHCGKEFEILTGHYNRAMSCGLRVYCSRKHSGIGRRLHKSKYQLKEEKWWYDGFNRLFMQDEIKAAKAEYFKKDYAANPEKYKKIRQQKMASH